MQSNWKKTETRLNCHYKFILAKSTPIDLYEIPHIIE